MDEPLFQVIAVPMNIGFELIQRPKEHGRHSVEVTRQDISFGKTNYSAENRKDGLGHKKKLCHGRSTSLIKLLTLSDLSLNNCGLRTLKASLGWIDLKITLIRQVDFDEASGKETVRISRGTNFVKPDGKISPAEDFANNVEYFLYDPKKLKDVTPHAYTWIKNHFGDSFKLGRGFSNGKKH